MLIPVEDATAEVERAVEQFHRSGDAPALQTRLAQIVDVAPADQLAPAAERFRELPEVAGPLYEAIVRREPANARALVSLASAYWLTGRGPEIVGELATRAMAADPENRGAWHLWALAESNPRERTARWQQVVRRFPSDDLARVNLADNAAALAGAEHDARALGLALATYEELLQRATEPAQRVALQRALDTLRKWTL